MLKIPRATLLGLVQTDSELSDLFMRAFMLRRTSLIAHGQGDVVLVGSSGSSDTLRVREFLSRNGHPFTYVDVDADANIRQLFDGFGVTEDDVPVVICRGERVLKKPSVTEVAQCIGLRTQLDAATVHDVVVVGAGPAGLAAAVYAASEGLDVLVIESHAAGGQAGSSSKIENYLGFPTGISGQALAARALLQAEKFGARFAVTHTAVKLECGARPYRLDLTDGQSVRARAVVIATGAEYRKPDLADLPQFEGVGVYYGETFVEAQLCGGDEVIVVGGGNSAGQAAVYLARSVRHVNIFVRASGLAESMSQYLVRRIEGTHNITLHTGTQIERLEGERHLERVTFRQGNSTPITKPVRHVFLMTGARPNTAWLEGCVALDDKGFVRTGDDHAASAEYAWPFDRAPQLLKTSLPGVFAVGDVRATSVKRVASAVGEGSICIQMVHKAIAEIADAAVASEQAAVR